MPKIVITRAQFEAARASATKTATFNLDGWTYTVRFVTMVERANLTTEFCQKTSTGWRQESTGKVFAHCQTFDGAQYCWTSKSDINPSLVIQPDAMVSPISKVVNKLEVVSIDTVSLKATLDVSIVVSPGRLQATGLSSFGNRFTFVVDLSDNAFGVKNFKVQ